MLSMAEQAWTHTYLFASGDSTGAGETITDNKGTGNVLRFLDATKVEDCSFSFSFNEQDQMVVSVVTGNNTDKVTLTGVTSASLSMNNDPSRMLYSFEYVNSGGTVTALSLMFGTSGDNDNLNGGAENDFIFGLAGIDTINGGGGNDTLYGGVNSDLLAGNVVGKDRLDGGVGSDTLNGGGGADLLDGGEGIDTVIYRGVGVGAVTIDLSSAVDGVTTASGGSEVTGDRLVSIENIIGSIGNAVNTLTGNSAVNEFTSNTGNDILSGGGGNDTLTGEAGGDTLTGGTGNDTLTGESGGDTYNFSAGSGTDTIVEMDGSEANKVRFVSTSAYTYVSDKFTFTRGTTEETARDLIITIDGADASGTDSVVTIEGYFAGRYLTIAREFLTLTIHTVGTDGTTETDLPLTLTGDGTENNPFVGTSAEETFTGTTDSDWPPQQAYLRIRNRDIWEWESRGRCFRIFRDNPLLLIFLVFLN